MKINSYIALALCCLIARPVNADDISSKAITYCSIAAAVSSIGGVAFLKYMANKYKNELVNRDISENRRNIVERNIKTCNVLMGICILGAAAGVTGTGYGLWKWNTGSIKNDKTPYRPLGGKPTNSDKSGEDKKETKVPSDQAKPQPTTIIVEPVTVEVTPKQNNKTPQINNEIPKNISIDTQIQSNNNKTESKEENKITKQVIVIKEQIQNKTLPQVKTEEDKIIPTVVQVQANNNQNGIDTEQEAINDLNKIEIQNNQSKVTVIKKNNAWYIKTGNYLLGKFDEASDSFINWINEKPAKNDVEKDTLKQEATLYQKVKNYVNDTYEKSFKYAELTCSDDSDTQQEPKQIEIKNVTKPITKQEEVTLDNAGYSNTLGWYLWENYLSRPFYKKQK